MQKFPETNEEFAELLAELNLPPEVWLRSPYSKEKIIDFAMLYAVWQASHSTQDSGVLTRRTVD